MGLEEQVSGPNGPAVFGHQLSFRRPKQDRRLRWPLTDRATRSEYVLLPLSGRAACARPLSIGFWSGGCGGSLLHWKPGFRSRFDLIEPLEPYPGAIVCAAVRARFEPAMATRAFITTLQSKLNASDRGALAPIDKTNAKRRDPEK